MSHRHITKYIPNAFQVNILYGITAVYVIGCSVRYLNIYVIDF